MPVRSGTDHTPPGSAPAVVRAIAVLDAIAESPTGFLSLSEVARAVGIPKSSASAICNALEAGLLIRRDDVGYRLGRRTVELGGAYLSRLDQVAEFYDFCAKSKLFANETVRLSVLAGSDTLCLARSEGRPALRLTSGIGDRFPASSSAQGKALLALLDDPEVERLFHGIPELPQATNRSIRTLPDLLADLGRTRQRGYGMDTSEAADHVVGLAVAIATRGVRSPLLAASVTLLDSQVTDERREAMVRELRRLASALGNPMSQVSPA